MTVHKVTIVIYKHKNGIGRVQDDIVIHCFDTLIEANAYAFAWTVAADYCDFEIEIGQGMNYGDEPKGGISL